MRKPSPALLLLLGFLCGMGAVRLARAGGPRLVVKVQPPVGMASHNHGARMTLTARIEGAMDERWYCPQIEWIWPDGTVSRAEEDCAPWEPRGDEGPRVWTQVRYFAAGDSPVDVELSKRGKVIAREQVIVQVAGGE
jgi:hypothetical protein